MPFREPETALAGAAEVRIEESLDLIPGVRPAASQATPTTFQRLTPSVNNLQIITTTYR